MDEKLTRELLDEFIPTLEALETQNLAILQFLKDKGIADDEQLAPYLNQAANASNVKWLAAKLRINHLISSAFKAAEREAEKEVAEITPKKPNKNEKNKEKTEVVPQASKEGNSNKESPEAENNQDTKPENKKRPDEKSAKDAA